MLMSKIHPPKEATLTNENDLPLVFAGDTRGPNQIEEAVGMIAALKFKVSELEAWKHNEEARITILGQMLQELADDTNPTGPLADAPVHAEVNRIIHEILNP